MAKGSTATIAVSLLARTKSFNKKIRGAKATLKRFASSAVAAGKKLARFGAIAAGAVAAGLVLLTKRAFEQMDVMTKLAKRTGDTTEAIAALQHTAQLMGASAEVMNKALDFMGKSLGEASMGVGEAKEAIAFLGLDVQKLIRMKPSEAFAEIAEATSNLGTQSEKAAIAADIFGRAGIKLVNTLDLGKKGLAANAEEARKLGISFSLIEGTQIENANDSVLRLKQIFVGVGRIIALKVAPAIEFVATKLTELGTKGEGSVGIINRGFVTVLRTIGKTVDIFNLLKSGVFGVKFVFLKMVGDMLRGFTVIQNVIVGLINKMVDLTGRGRKIAASEGFLGKGFGLAADEAFKNMEDSFRKFTEGSASKGLDQWFKDIALSSKKAAEAATVSTDKITKAAKGTLFSAFAPAIANLLAKGAKAALDALRNAGDSGPGASRIGGREIDFRNVAFGAGGAARRKKKQDVHDETLTEKVVELVANVKEQGAEILSFLGNLIPGATP